MSERAPNQIRSLREGRGWSMDELGSRLTPPATASQINKLEKGYTRLTFEWMQRLARALECHPAQLLPDAPLVTDPREQALLDLYRGLSEQDRQAAFRFLDAMAKTDKS